MQNQKSLLLKSVLIGLLTLALLLPLKMIQGLIGERQNRKQEVIKDIGQKWGTAQKINGPWLGIHYNVIEKQEKYDSKGHKFVENYIVPKTYYLAPTNLQTDAQLDPTLRKRGIYEIVLYESKINLHGKFTDLKTKLEELKAHEIFWNRTELIVGLQDLKGLKSSDLRVNDLPVTINHSAALPKSFGNALIAPLNTIKNDQNEIGFDLKLAVKGSEQISFLPIAENSITKVTSPWESPKFEGTFIPDTNKISKNGFEAHWQISHLNRNLPLAWEAGQAINFEEVSYGLSLLNVNDNYQKSDRSVKYSFLIVVLTFLSFLFVELIYGLKMHPIQYALIGFALCLFYTLLVSFSEYMLFNWAYVLSSLMIIGMIWLYTRSLLQHFSTLIAGVLICLYGYIFSIIQLEDTALLVGSLGLFVILAITMYFSRKINWSTL